MNQRIALILAALLLALVLVAGCTENTERKDIKISGRPYKGTANASVVVVDFSDFECPYCKQAVATEQYLLGKYAGKIKIVFKQFPLVNIHIDAMKAAQASECAHEQGKFWEYHDMLFDNQQRLADADLKSYAKYIGLDSGRFDACLGSGIKEAIVLADLNEGGRIGVRATPTFFVNGIQVSSPVQANVDKAVAEELAKTG
jgi:protein-disulfide isomerase